MKRGLFWIGMVLLFLAALVVAEVTYAERYEDRIFPGVTIGSLPLGGKTRAEAQTALETTTDALVNHGIVLNMAGQTTTLSSTVRSFEDPDLAREFITFDRRAALDAAFAVGRGPNVFKNTFTQIRARISGLTIPIIPHVNRDELNTLIHQQFASVLVPAKNASFAITWDEQKTEPILTLVREEPGTAIDLAATVTEIEQQLANLTEPRVVVVTFTEEPRVTSTDAARLEDTLREFLTHGPWTLVYGRDSWPITREEIGVYLALEKDERGSAQIVFDAAALEPLFDTIASRVNRPPQNAKFKIENGRVLEFQGSAPGIEFDREATRIRMNDVLITKAGTNTELITQKSEPDTTTGEVNDLGIEGVLGVGTSNYRGSPPNRVKNIRNAVRLLNGLLIKPDEEFSLVAALRPFTLENGYVPGLVIKGDKLEPEIGGGLCQIGTTTFRAAMNSGFPITQRRNHSLVVNYYSDPTNGNPGTDATIYDPFPDFRFKNDTGTHLLLTTEMDAENTELHFTFWGTSDGRKGYYSPPVVDRWIGAGPTKIIETTELEPGKKTCEPKHVGADTHFTYTVERPDQEKEEVVFSSHYRPLPEICLVGVAAVPESVPVEDGTDDSLGLTPVEAADLPVE